LIGFESMKGSHTGELMAGILYNVLKHFNITQRLLCITTDNAGNNGVMRKELEELLNNLDIDNGWSSDSTKIPCLAHVIQLVVKAILGAFDIKPAESEGVDDDVNGRSVNSTIAKVWY
jgi:hypothetical protein